MPKSFLKGIIYALGACFIWGLIFIVPLFMKEFTSIEITLGRYLTFGTISAAIFFKNYYQKKSRYPLSIWLKAFAFALVCIAGYVCLVLSVRYANAAMSALIMGICPVCIAFYGNWKQDEGSYKNLLLPCNLILLGMMVINAPHIMESTSPSTYVIGLFCAVLSLIGWSWYVVENASLLKRNRQMDTGEWVTLIGIGTLFWVMFLGMFYVVFFGHSINLEKYLMTSSSNLWTFFMGSFVSGILCSWVAECLWNKASLYLPVSLAGQLTIFETLFGLSFVYTLEQKLPSLIEFLGVTFLLIAIFYGIRVSLLERRKQYLD